MKVQGLAPRFDDSTEYSFKWYTRTIEKTKDKYELLELLEDRAKREIFERENSTFLPDIIVFYDHGDSSGLVQQDGEGYVIDTRNISQIKGKILYTMACSSAKELGVKAWTLEWVYVGYTDLFGFTVQDEEIFCEVAGHGFVLIVNGETDFKKVKLAMIDKFNEYLTKEGLDPWTRFWLRHDRDALACYNGEEPPPSGCVARRMAVRLFGRKGWLFTRLRGLALLIAGIGIGVYIHDRIVEWVVLGCRLHGIDAGFALLLLAFTLGLYDFLKGLKKSA